MDDPNYIIYEFFASAFELDYPIDVKNVDTENKKRVFYKNNKKTLNTKRCLRTLPRRVEY
jgi:hypothetical protein